MPTCPWSCLRWSGANSAGPSARCSPSTRFPTARLTTIPQIFIGGQFIGGATELFDAAKDGSMQKLLEENTVHYNKNIKDDPYSFLPGWLHKR